MARTAMTPAREGLTLAAALADFSADQLLNLLQARPDLASPPPRDFAALAARASTWASVNDCMVTLNRAALQLVDAVALLPQPTTTAALVRILAVELDADDLEAALDHLAGLGLVFRRGDNLRVHPQIEHLAHPAGLGPPANTVLAFQQQTTLTTIAQRLGVNPGRTKHDTVAALAVALADPAVIKATLHDAPPGTPAVVTRLAQHPVESIPWGTHTVRPDTPLGWLAGRGFVVATDWSSFVMPREVGLAFRGGRPFPDFSLRPPVINWRPADADAIDRAAIEAAQRIVADIATILDSWQDAPPKLLKAGGLGIREVRRAATAIGRTEIEAARVIDLAAVAGLAGWDSTEAVAGARPPYQEWLQMGVAQRWAVVAQAWLEADIHVNLAGALGANEKPIPPLLDRWPETAAAGRRRLVLAALAEGAVGEAMDAGLAARVTWDAPALWNGGPAMPPTLVSWVGEEAAVLGICAALSLSCLGRLVADGRLDEATAELARHCPPTTSQFVIQADLTAVATGPLSVAVRAELDLMADLESSGSATVYRFSEQSLRRAFDDGRSAEGIVGFLSLHATKGVPQPLSYLVEDIGRRHGRLRVGSATCYLRSDDASVLTEILLSRRLLKLGLRQLAPTVLVSGATPEAVIDALRTNGYLPAEEDEAGDIVVRRRLVSWVAEGMGPPPPKAAPRRGPAAASGPKDEPLASIVRRLRTARSNAVAKPAPGQGSNGAPPTPAPFSQLKLLEPERPSDIVRLRPAVLELLIQAHLWEWWLRLEYTNKRGRSEQINATVFNYDERYVTVGTMPDHGTLRLAMSRISWVRVMTEAEESLL